MTKNSKQSLWVLGTGTSLYYHKEEIKRLKDHTTLAFHRTFPNCVEHFGFFPTYWTWWDPQSALEGINYLLKLNKVPQEMTVLIPNIHVQSFEKFTQHYGISPGWRYHKRDPRRSKKTYDAEYIEKVKTLVEKGLKVEYLTMYKLRK